MPTRRRERFVHAQLAWLLAATVVLAALDALDAELFFVVALIGFLVVVELTAPVNLAPRWRRRLKWLLLLGLAAFGYVVVRRVLGVLPPGVL